MWAFDRLTFSQTWHRAATSALQRVSQLSMADKRRARVVAGGGGGAATAAAVDAEGTKVTRFAFVQKRKKLNDNLLWAADATPTPTPTPTATATLTLTLATAVQSAFCLSPTNCRPPSLTRSLSSRLLACVVFVGFVCSSLLRLLLYNALLHAAHFTYFNHECISYTALFSICISLLWLRQMAFVLVLFSCLLCTAILRGQGYNFLFSLVESCRHNTYYIFFLFC